ncbi:MAG TPA: alpha/beta hydrolase [Candidatus Limnocylindrales bacterium]|nr:alpha/beta hydrolase [Candidatus Limnocylindrales bacterium]
MAADPTLPLEPWSPDVAVAPAPDPALEPEGFVVTADDGTRLHFLDWGGPGNAAGVLLLPGLLQPAWSWAPVARRLARVTRPVVADLRGQGLSDSPMSGYDLGTLAADAVAVAEGSGLLARGAIVVAGHGFGGIVAAAAAHVLGPRCAGVVLVDGGWERLEVTTDVDVDEFLRGLDEPPEVLRSMDGYLADRRGYDPSTWDRDQERAARDAVVETAAGHVVRAVRPHVVEAMVHTMFGWDPAIGVRDVESPIAALVALGSADAAARLAELRRTADAHTAAGNRALRVTGFPGVAHNLMRYRPADVTAAILGIA